MLKTAISLMFFLFCAASHAQLMKPDSLVNPKMHALFEQLTTLGEAPKIHKTGGEGNPTHLHYDANLYYSPDMYGGVHDAAMDSLLQEGKSKLRQQVKAIRHTLDDLQEEAYESYHYEYHNDGIDTIIYSMNFCRDTTRVDKYQTYNLPYYYSDENLYFRYQPNTKEGSYTGHLNYVVTLPKPSPSPTPYTVDSLMADIARLFKQQRIKPRKVLWRHDKEYSDTIWASSNVDDFCYMTKFNDTCPEGVTDATIYTMPLAQEQQAWLLLAELDSLALQYTNRQEKLYYNYNYNTTFREPFRACILSTFPANEPTTQNYHLDLNRDDNGFHFLIAQTKGTLWIPRDWPCIKSFINGKKTYFKVTLE